MPIRYTYTQVNNIFATNGCQLLTDNYKNQLQILDYIAECGHPNSISIKQFVNGSGIKCFNCAKRIPTFEDVCSVFISNNCILGYSKEEFNNYYKNNCQKLSYTASCGHQNVVSYKNFKTLDQGIICPSCVTKNSIEKLKLLRSGNKNNSSIELEYRSFLFIESILDKHFTIEKTFAGCKSDFVIKPKNVNDNKWLGIQLKTTSKKTERNQYYFRINETDYSNLIILCFCEEDKKIWAIPYQDIYGKKTIGIATSSKYNKYELNTTTIVDKMNQFYMDTTTFTFEQLNIPTSLSQKQEQDYCNLRETKLDFISFEQCQMEGTVYDFTVGELKFQEKVGSICKKNNPNMFSFNLEKNCGKHKKTSYKKGDNDFYWLNCKNGYFYVIPEDELILHKYIGEQGKQHLYVSPTNKNTEWANNYMFDYENIDKERLLNLLKI